MPIEILMPALSPTMTEGKLAKWLVKEGDTVESGTLLAEIETDKATMEFEAVDDGTVGRLLIAAGTEGVAVNTPIALLLTEGEGPEALEAAAAAAGKASEAAPAPSASAPSPATASAPTASAAGSASSGGRVFATPLARRIAAQNQLELGAIDGSGPYGRIIRADVEAALSAGTGKAQPGAAAAASATTAAPAPVVSPSAAASAPSALGKEQVVALAGNLPYREQPHSSMRKTIARRLTESKQTVPHFYLTIDCRLDKLLAMRKELNGRAGEEGIKLSVNDFIIRAVALALRKVPAANASWSEEAILFWEQVDVAVAVALPDGLITPVLREADRKGLATLSSEMKDLATRARDGKLSPAEYQGGTFTVSNLGMFGIREFSAIINPPHGCLLAVGQGEQRPVVENGALAVATVMSCTLSVDHRVVDGAIGAQFLAAFKGLIEDPLTMLL